MLQLEYHNVIYEWDDEKERININKHGIDFKTAIRVFDDLNAVELFDYDH